MFSFKYLLVEKFTSSTISLNYIDFLTINTFFLKLEILKTEKENKEKTEIEYLLLNSHTY